MINLNIEFTYIDYIKEKTDKKEIIFENTDINFKELRGLFLKYSDKIMISLSAEQWKDLEFQELTDELDKTITHELIHKLISESETDIAYTFDGEENVCMIVAGQK